MAFESEAELAKIVLDWLIADAWDCYPEVQVKAYDNRADIVAVKHNIIYVVECKKNLGLAVMSQASYWRHRAHYVSVAVTPGNPYKNASHRYALELCKKEGIGVLYTYRSIQNPWTQEIEIAHCTYEVGPKLYRTASNLKHYILNHLDDDMKNYQPGTREGYSTPYNRTIKATKTFIKENPGCTIRDIIENIHHHYSKDSTARSVISKDLQTWNKSNIRVEQDGKFKRFYWED